MSREYITWNMYDRIINEIVKDIKKKGRKYDMIVTFARGGLVPATHLANLLDIQEVMVINNDLHLFSSDCLNSLIVDDISDSGETLEPYKDHDIACVCFKSGTKVKPTFRCVEFSDDKWIVFPWEARDSKEVRDRDVKRVIKFTKKDNKNK